MAANIAEVAAAMRRNVERELARARIADGSANGRADVGNVVRQVVAVVRRTPDGTGLEWVVDLPPTSRRGSIRTTSPKRSAISWKMPPACRPNGRDHWPLRRWHRHDRHQR